MSEVGSRSSVARWPAGRWTLVIACFTAAITASVVYPLARWQAAQDAAHCGDGEDHDATLTTLPPSSEPAVSRFVDDPSLKFVVVLFRHGDRTPVFKYKTDPLANAFPEELGELTKKGKQHMYKKGQIFRHLYNGFLSDLYLDNEIIIKTTKTRRTFMSAAMVLAGLYPPRDYQKWSVLETVWQPIPIYHDSTDDSTLYIHPGICPAFDSLKDKLWLQIFENTEDNITEPLFSYLSEKCGQPITIKNAYYLLDTFKCQESEDLQIPEWLKPNHLQTIQSIFENNKTAKVLFGNPLIQKFSVGRLMEEIVLEMESRSNNSESGNTSRKMHFYSGHDLSVGNIMGILGTFIENVDFGASVHIHLYLDEKIGHTVKVFYFDRWDDEKGREVTIPTCGDHCKLQDFIKLVRHSFVRDWEEECQMIEK